MKKVTYSIGTDPRRRRSVELYLWREEDGETIRVAKFIGHKAAKIFAKEFDFPLGEYIRAMTPDV